MPEIPLHLLIAAGALVCGFIIGAVSRALKFCTFCAVRDLHENGGTALLRIWMLAIGTAMISLQILNSLVDLRLSETIYLSGNFGWAGAIIGGLVFGFGMALTRSCAFSLVVRAGTGDLRALTAFLVMGFSAYMAARGLTGLARVAWIEPLATNLSAFGGQGIPELLAPITGIAAEDLRLPLGIGAGLAFVFWAFSSRRFRPQAGKILGAVLVGLTVTAAFALTGFVGNDDFEPVRVEGLSYVMPSGESLIYLMTFTGATLNFGVALIAGTALGALAVSLLQRDNGWQGFSNTSETGHYIVGGFLMGFGGVTALGCTIGQGISGMATLSASAPIALVSIIAGGLIAQRLFADTPQGLPLGALS
jgi:uncharacterized membrane protein YedE/YeeE